MSITTKTYYQVPEVNLSYSTNFKVSERPIINSSSTANDIFLAHWEELTFRVHLSFRFCAQAAPETIHYCPYTISLF
ncbi:hypothetical protein [Mucilaginibacter sp. UYCu711]|uniref:hypothetical protein n=1 Tax=Mucilaginibacter sp. UYCu711 TaxID=3156339 RepID=UPI003D1A5ADB